MTPTTRKRLPCGCVESIRACHTFEVLRQEAVDAHARGQMERFENFKRQMIEHMKPSPPTDTTLPGAECPRCHQLRVYSFPLERMRMCVSCLCDLEKWERNHPEQP